MSGPVKVWSKFSIIRNFENVYLKIVDLPRFRIKELADVMVNYYAKEEVTFTATVEKDEEALMEYRDIITQMLSKTVYHATVCCVDKGDGKIEDFLGASMMMLPTNKNIEAKLQPKSKTLETLLQMSWYMDSLYEPKKIHNLERYYEDRGGFVRPDFRGYGIFQEFLRVSRCGAMLPDGDCHRYLTFLAGTDSKYKNICNILRRLICKEHGVPMIGAWMTSYGSQKAAIRDGWEVKYELDREELSKRFGVSFDSDSPPVMLFMVAKI